MITEASPHPLASATSAPFDQLGRGFFIPRRERLLRSSLRSTCRFITVQVHGFRLCISG
jgi:hypothetical protein